MIEVVVCTNRDGSNSKKIAENIVKKFAASNTDARLLELSSIDWSELNSNQYGEEARSKSMSDLIKRIDEASGLYMVVPEYNGSYPGVVKTFIDYWSYPKSFEKRPVCFLGLGGIFGGLRPVEHLQQVFGYRNAFVFPERVFLRDVWSIIDEAGEVKDPVLKDLINVQVKNFITFIKSLEDSKLHANSNNTLN